MIKRIGLITLGVMFFLGIVVFQKSLGVKASSQSTFNNPIKVNRGGDPYVYKGDDGYYYMIVTEGAGNNYRITLRRAKSVVDIAYGEQKVIYNVASTATDCWAGEIQKINGVWYIYYTRTESGDDGRRMHCIKCTDSDPFTGAWSYVGQISDPTNLYAIDGDVFNNNGKLYMIWSGRNGTDNNQRIYIASMSNPYTINSDRTCISSPTNSWEINGSPVNEGPIALIKKGKVYITFSASNFATDDYCLGLLTTSQSSDLLDASSWTKTGPVFSKSPENSVYGPGHNGFFKSSDGTEDWLIYHAVDVSGQIRNQRDTRIQKITWNGNVPIFGTPVANGTALNIPSGDIKTDKYEAENAIISGATKYTTTNADEYNGFAGTGYIKYVNNSGDYVTFNITAAVAGRYNLLFRYTNDTKTTNTLQLTVNGDVVNSGLVFPSTANANDNHGIHYYNYSNSTQYVNLVAGENIVKLETTGNNGPWLDSLIIAKDHVRF